MYEPRIVCFLCKWCTSAGADLAGTSRLQYTPSGVNIRFMCSSRVDPEHVLWAFREGADGVLIGGCHPGDCHYQDGNYRTQARTALLHRLLEDFGVDQRRLRLEWISAAEGRKFAAVMDEFTEQLRQMGPLRLAAREMING
ncbi:MAG: hydrogenase iron-sulfur subunit [Candidatus Fermentibacteraceae bacterium]